MWKFLVPALFLAVPSASADQVLLPPVSSSVPKTTEVARGRGFVIHAVPSDNLVSGSGYLLLHASLPAGKPKVLMVLGEPPVFTTPAKHLRTEVVGMIVKGERIVVLTAHRTVETTAVIVLYGLRQYHLSLIEAREGKSLSTASLKGVHSPKARIDGTLKAGPLKWKRNVITLFGRKVRIEKDRLLLLPATAKPRK